VRNELGGSWAVLCSQKTIGGGETAPVIEKNTRGVDRENKRKKEAKF